MKPPKRVHLLGIGGVGMGALAGLLREAGLEVSGSEAGPVYPPMSDLLQDLKIPVFIGYRPENLQKAAPELAIIGNVIRADNPEAQAVFEQRIPYLSLPEALYGLFIKGKKSLVVCGTHGKSTTSALLAFALENLGKDPTFLVGALLRDRGRNFRYGRGPFVILEGDEYDTAFFDKRPKFVHYAPWAAILTSVEFDHADIYPDLKALEAAFSSFVSLLPKEGVLLVSNNQGAQRVAGASSAKVITYGSEGDFVLLWRRPLQTPRVGQEVSFAHPKGETKFFLPLIGAHNAENALGVFALLFTLGLAPEEIAQVLSSFPGIKRRQEILCEKPVIIIDDFAHHPTAVRVTIEAVREVWPGARLLAVFEPRTNTSKRRHFQKDYVEALAEADQVFLKVPQGLDQVPPEERIDLSRISEDLRSRGISATYFEESRDLFEALKRALSPGDLVLFMSNGPLDGLPQRLKAFLKGS